MSELPAAALRALAGLIDGTGETLVLVGPPFSGKSEILAELQGRLEAAGSHVVSIRGSYRDREVPFGALYALDEERTTGPWFPDAPSDSESVPGPALPYIPDVPVEPRRRGSGPRRGVVLGHPYVTPARAAPKRDPAEYWRGLVQGFAASRRTVAILVEDAAFLDPQSREFLLALSDRASLRPFLLVLVLDSQVPSYGAWEERLVSRGDVDWVRRARAKPNPRDVRHLKETLDRLPEGTRRAIGFIALMGGNIPEVYLARVTRRSAKTSLDTLQPAIDRGIVKFDAGRIMIAHDHWIPILPTLLPEAERTEMHHEIAETLAALSPEPSLERRLEVAGHYFEWYHGPAALRYLLETAEISERLNAFDAAAGLVTQALACVPSLPAAERASTDTELHLLHARVLIYSGRPGEGEQALREGVSTALKGGVPPPRLEEWIETLLPALRAAGPRPSLLSELVDLAERCQSAEYPGAEVLLQSTLAELEYERSRKGKAREDAHRALRLARSLGRGSIQATAMVAIGVTRMDGTPDERLLAEKFLRTARAIFSEARRYGLEQTAEEYLIRAIESQGERAAALRGREKAVPTAQRLRALVTELDHQLGIAALLMDELPDARLTGALRRAREIVGLLHLRPPSLGLLRLWLLEGRLDVGTKNPDAARDRWRAIVDLAPALVPPRIRAEASLRLAILEVSEGHDAEARPYLERLASPDLRVAIRPEWFEWIAPLRQRVGVGPTAYPPGEPGRPGSSAG